MSNQLLLRRRAMFEQSKEVIIHNIPPITITRKRNLLSVKAFGECVQNGTPTPDNPVDIVSNNGVLKVDNQGNIYADGTVETITITPDGGTATAEILLSVGDYQDVQSIIDGVVTRNVGVKVFDGTEIFVPINNTFRCTLTGLLMNNKVMCNYFDGNVEPSVRTQGQPDLTVKGNDAINNTMYFKYAAKTTIEDFQQWLADQYAAGTPVIVIYPLVKPTTKQVSGQALTLTSGTNVIDITQASLQGLELEVKAR